MKAAVAGFGELWEVDSASSGLQVVSFYRVQVRYQHFRVIPRSLSLMVEDRRFTVPIAIDSWEEACPILLREVTDRRLGLETEEEKDRFIRHSGFSCIPAAEGLSGFPAHCPRPNPGFRLDLGDFPSLAPASPSSSSTAAPLPLVPGLPPGRTSGAIAATSSVASPASSPSAPPTASLPPSQACLSVTLPLASAFLVDVVAPPPSAGSGSCPCPGLGVDPPLGD